MSRIFELITTEGIRRFSDSDLPLAIGSGTDAHIYLPEGIRKTSAWLAESRGYLFLQAAEDGEPVYHNDELVQASSVWIKSGDTTRIGSTLLGWHIVGDRVEIRLYRAGENVLTPPAVAPDNRGGAKTLPRVRTDEPKRAPRKQRWLPVGLFFAVLVLASVFLLTAQRFEVDVQPEPDSMTVSGFPLVAKIGDTFLALDGTYTLKAEKSGYKPLSEQIIVENGGDKKITFSLEKLPGRVDIVSRPVDGAAVYVDDNPIGTTPLSGVELAAGSHLLRVEKERYLPLEQPLGVTGAGVLQSVVVDLQPGWGTVSLRSDPVGAIVIRDDKVLGETPLTIELMAGKVLLQLKKEKFSPAELELAVIAGQELEPEPVRLVPAPATITLRSDPAGAMVSIGSTFAGTTPVTLELPSGVEQNIHLQLAGYEPVTLKQKFLPGSEQEIFRALQAVYGTVLLSTDPVDATLLIDGKPHGPATGRLRLTTREHRLTVRAKGFEDAIKTVVPKKGVSQQVEIRLQKKGETAATMTRPVKKNKKMIRLGPATVQMGAARREPGRRANEQERTVQLSRSFQLAIAPVTNGEFRRFKPSHRSGSAGGRTLDGEKQPVVNVSWEDAAQFCNWLSLKQGLPEFYKKQGKTMVPVSPVNTGYRLPTEAEWAFAARIAGRQERARYPWPGKFPPRVLSGNFGDESARTLLPVVIRGYNDGFAVTAPVGSFPKNPGGFFDLGGNVSQWCHDWYTPYAGIGEQKAGVDTMGPGSGTHHVVRGSSWRDATISSLRLSYRGYSKVAKNDIGFRVARYLQ